MVYLFEGAHYVAVVAGHQARVLGEQLVEGLHGLLALLPLFGLDLRCTTSSKRHSSLGRLG